MRLQKTPFPTAILAIAALVSILALLAQGSRLVAAAPNREPLRKAPTSQPTPEPAQAASANPQIKQLDDQLQDLRTKFHSQLDPLQAQIKALRDQFEPQIKSLEDQRRTLIEQGKPPQVQQLDEQERTDLARLDDREKAAIEKVRQDFAEQRKDLREKYQKEIKEILASKH